MLKTEVTKFNKRMNDAQEKVIWNGHVQAAMKHNSVAEVSSFDVKPMIIMLIISD